MLLAYLDKLELNINSFVPTSPQLRKLSQPRRSNYGRQILILLDDLLSQWKTGSNRYVSVQARGDSSPSAEQKADLVDLEYALNAVNQGVTALGIKGTKGYLPRGV